MRNFGKLLMMAFVVLFAFNSCDEDAITLLPFTDIDDFMASKAPESEIYNVTLDQDHTFELENGTIVEIDSNSFCLQSGGTATGDIKLEFKEVFKKSEMIFEQKTTESDGKLLESGGEFFMEATQNNQRLLICSNVRISIPKSDKTSDPASMQLFYGDSSGDEFDWSSTGGQAEFWVQDSSYNMQMFSDFDWINCDYFYGSSDPKTTVSAVPVGTSGTSSNTIAFIIFKDINAVASMNYNSTTNQFESYENSLPIGQEATIVIIGMSETAYYLGTQDITVSTDLVVNVDLEEVTEAEMTAIIEALN